MIYTSKNFQAFYGGGQASDFLSVAAEQTSSAGTFRMGVLLAPPTLEVMSLISPANHEG